jgi:hypothetical protein
MDPDDFAHIDNGAVIAVIALLAGVFVIGAAIGYVAGVAW